MSISRIGLVIGVMTLMASVGCGDSTECVRNADCVNPLVCLDGSCQSGLSTPDDAGERAEFDYAFQDADAASPDTGPSEDAGDASDATADTAADVTGDGGDTTSEDQGGRPDHEADRSPRDTSGVVEVICDFVITSGYTPPVAFDGEDVQVAETTLLTGGCVLGRTIDPCIETELADGCSRNTCLETVEVEYVSVGTLTLKTSGLGEWTVEPAEDNSYWGELDRLVWTGAGDSVEISAAGAGDIEAISLNVQPPRIDSMWHLPMPAEDRTFTVATDTDFSFEYEPSGSAVESRFVRVSFDSPATNTEWACHYELDEASGVVPSVVLADVTAGEGLVFRAFGVKTHTEDIGDLKVDLELRSGLVFSEAFGAPDWLGAVDDIGVIWETAEE